MRRLIVPAGLLAAVITGCFHRSRHSLRIGQQVNLPQGLDSVSTAQWLARQRAACPGTLTVTMDHMPIVSLDGSPVPYQSGIVFVVCSRR